MTMAHGLEGRVPFLDVDLIDVAQRIDPRLKRRGGTEKWILREAVADLLPESIVWRDKAQFDEGSGSVDLLAELVRDLPNEPGPAAPFPLRSAEEEAYYRMFAGAFPDPEAAAAAVGRWHAGRTPNAAD